MNQKSIATNRALRQRMAAAIARADVLLALARRSSKSVPPLTREAGE